MKGKSVKSSSVHITQFMTPQDANIAGNVYGGVIMGLVDTAGGIVARRHARTNVVTASIDRMDFLNPVYVGELATAKASLNYTGKTSIEVGVHVQSEDLASSISPSPGAFRGANDLKVKPFTLSTWNLRT